MKADIDVQFMLVSCLYLSFIPNMEAKYSLERPLTLARLLIVTAVITLLQTFINATAV
jgi:hypothetical protein